MAKKSSKKSSKSTGALVLKGIIVVMGILAVCMAFLPFVNQAAIVGGKTVSTYSLTGFQAGFGASAEFSSSTTSLPGWISFGADKASVSNGVISYSLSPIGGITATLVIAIVALVIALVSFALKDKKISGVTLGVVGLLFVAAGIMFFFPVQFGGFETQIAEILGAKNGVEYSLGVGAILSAIFSLVAGLVGLAGAAISFKK